jgi:hypothetical protein
MMEKKGEKNIMLCASLVSFLLLHQRSHGRNPFEAQRYNKEREREEAEAEAEAEGGETVESSGSGVGRRTRSVVVCVLLSSSIERKAKNKKQE